MTKMDYLKLLVDEIHSTTVATIGSDGHPQTRIIDMMYYDEEGVYFLTAKGENNHIFTYVIPSQFSTFSFASFLNICNAIKDLAIQHPDVDFVYPMHLNPNVRKPSCLSGREPTVLPAHNSLQKR